MPPTCHPGKVRRARAGGRDGSALLLTVSFIMITGLVTGALLNAATTHRRLADRAYHRERAFNLAEAGFEKACGAIIEHGELLPDPYCTNGTIGGASFACTVTRAADWTYRVASTGESHGVRWTVRSGRVEYPTWARFALWMDVNGPLYFIGGEEFHGHVHANTLFHFDNTAGDGADFYDRCTSAQGSFVGTTNGSTFAYGLELNADQDSLGSVDFSRLQTAARTIGLVVTGQTVVAFTGTAMQVTNERRGWTNHVVTVGTNFVLYVQNDAGGNPNPEGRITVSGTLNGRITLVSEEDAYIAGHLTCASHPTNAGADDAIGIVSQDDIWIDPAAPDNLNVHASMMATGTTPGEDGSFGVIAFDTGVPRGNLEVWGSIVQEYRGAVGTFNSSGPVTGYSKRYHFDLRNATRAPPFYPRLSTKLLRTEWREGPP